MADTSELAGLIRERLETYPDRSDKQLARMLLKTIGVTGRPAVLLIPLVEDHFGLERRHNTAALERAVFNGGSHRNTIEGAEPIDRNAARKRLYDERIPGDSGILWGDATIEELEAAKTYMLAKIGGMEATVRRIDAQIARLRETGARCLRDIAEDDAA